MECLGLLLLLLLLLLLMLLHDSSSGQRDESCAPACVIVISISLHALCEYTLRDHMISRPLTAKFNGETLFSRFSPNTIQNYTWTRKNAHIQCYMSIQPSKTK